MMTPNSYLEWQEKQYTPGWLGDYRSGDPINLEEFFKSRVVYYPGADDDIHAIKVFGLSRSAHCFIYLDYGTYFTDDSDAEDGVRRLLSELQSNLDFRVIGEQILRDTDVFSRRFRSRIRDELDERNLLGYRDFLKRLANVKGRLVILEQEGSGLKMALMLLNADGHFSYEALFCRQGRKAPFAVLAQNNGYGGDYSSFGRDGLLHAVATATRRWPKYLLCSTHNTKPWQAFKPLEQLEPTFGGWYGFERVLYKRS